MKNYCSLTLAFSALAALLPLPLAAQQLPVDRDGDGHSDLWQIHHGIPSANGNADSDGDGVSDAGEERAGTNPWDAQSVFGLADFQLLRDARGSESARFVWPALSGKQYQFESSGHLVANSWADLGLPVVPPLSGLATVQFPLPAGGARRFFRAQVSDIDADHDGLTAWEESLIGTSDLTPNSGGTAAPPDTVIAATWADTHDPGLSAGTPPPNLREVDVAFIRYASGGTGAPNPASGADLVTVTGTGAWHQLTSWRALNGSNPLHLFTAPPHEGHHALVHLLSPAKVANAPLFVTGRIRQGVLWISCRSLAANGAFLHHATNGWAPRQDWQALEFDVAHRAVSNRTLGITHYHVAAALLQKNTVSGTRSLNVIVWRVDAMTGALTALDDAGISGPDLHGEPRIRIAHVAADQFQLTYRDHNGRQVHHSITVDDTGTASGSGGVASNDIRGGPQALLSQEDAGISGLTATGYVTVSRQPDASMRFSVWDRRPQTSVPGVFIPHLIANEQTDLAPNAPGIAQAVPNLTDSYPGAEDPGEGLGQALATGDFNGDGCDDAALGAPFRDAGGAVNSGGVFTMHGSFDGMKNAGYAQYWRQAADGIGGDNAANDNFGNALAAGDFNGDGNDDLAVGIPGEDNNAGNVLIMYGTPFGLSAAGSHYISRAVLGQAVVAGDQFGAALAAGDFNGDGRDDLAIGAPGENISGQDNAGAVHVLWGSVTGLTTTDHVWRHQDSAGIADTAEPGDDFGRSLTAGNFNGGPDDLAIGAPLEDVGAVDDAGAVHVFYGGAGGFTASNFITRNGFSGGQDIQGAPTEFAWFGWSLAAGDFNNDTAEDLAIGVPGDDAAGPQTGALHVLFGSFLGLTWVNEQMIRQNGTLPLASSLPSFDNSMEDLGWSLAAGDCNGDGYADLMASAPGEDIVPDKSDGGAYFAIPGSAAGLVPADALMVQQDTQDVAGSAADDDKFAMTLACGDFNADGECDVIAGIPRKDKDDENQNTGAAHFFRGSEESIVSFTTDFMWTNKRLEAVRGIVSDLSREDSGGPGAGKLYSYNEWLPAVHMASSTKTMTLLLTVEALEDGYVALDDDVVVSELAGKTGGSTLRLYDENGNLIKDDEGNNIAFIQPGDVMPLRLLMAGMMGESCNRCSVAIGEHVANAVKGDPKEFISMMNDRAAELGMTTSVMGHPAHGWVTQIQDTVNLQREGVKHSIFVKFTSFLRYGDDPEEVLTGSDSQGNPKPSGPFNQFKSMGSYPGSYTWKGGNGGGWLGSDDANNVPDKPAASWCTASQVTTVRRMSRTLSACLQQTDDASGDLQQLYDYGFRRIFAPDLRGSHEFPQGGGVIGPEGPVRVRNFAVTGWEGRGVTAVIDDLEELRLNIWTIDAANSKILPAGASVRSYTLASGSAYEEPAQVGLTEVPSNDSLSDFFTANLIGERLELKAWRVDQQ